eukprot:TRINITY_DN16153_c0_g1_i1.p1 TRINITY_DN16153_c0_g1~~TRINITY_DN16153_c0_g1_i1.p1  ORF type:complete len:261 (-),score=41.93 TRINITY_DN16153_c0_g1_i1:35-817(-)
MASNTTNASRVNLSIDLDVIERSDSEAEQIIILDTSERHDVDGDSEHTDNSMPTVLKRLRNCGFSLGLVVQELACQWLNFSLLLANLLCSTGLLVMLSSAELAGTNGARECRLTLDSYSSSACDKMVVVVAVSIPVIIMLFLLEKRTCFLSGSMHRVTTMLFTGIWFVIWVASAVFVHVSKDQNREYFNYICALPTIRETANCSTAPENSTVAFILILVQTGLWAGSFLITVLRFLKIMSSPTLSKHQFTSRKRLDLNEG